MSMTTQTYQLDIVPFGPPVIIPMSQYDTGSRTLAFTLYNAQQPFTIPDGATAMIGGTKPDGHAFEYTCTVTDQTITCDVTEQMTAVAGYTDCEITLSKGTERLATANFKLHVERSALDQEDISDSDFNYVLDLTNTAVEKAASAASSAKKASDYADTASGASENAAKSAKAASGSADTATAASSSATESAKKASDYADAALTSATNAAGYAGEAEYRLMINPETGHMALAHYKKEDN